MTESNITRRCAECKTIADCKTAFGKFWPEKSNGGVGCNCPFPGYQRPTALEKALKGLHR